MARVLVGVLAIVVSLVLTGCVGAPHLLTPASTFPELSVDEDGSELNYLISTYQYRGNEIGELQGVTAYRVFFKVKKLQGGSTFYHFYRIQKAEEAASVSALTWKAYDKIQEYKTVIDNSDDVNAGKRYLDQIPHDGIDTYNIYVSLMDIVMYYRYVRLASTHLGGDHDVYELVGGKSQVADWRPVLRDIRFEETPTFLYLVGTNGKDETVYYYKNDNTRIYQTMSLGILTIPSKGTTRFVGFVRVDRAGDIVSATLSEYFTMEIWPLFFWKMNMFVRREQILERLQ